MRKLMENLYQCLFLALTLKWILKRSKETQSSKRSKSQKRKKKRRKRKNSKSLKRKPASICSSKWKTLTKRKRSLLNKTIVTMTLCIMEVWDTMEIPSKDSQEFYPNALIQGLGDYQEFRYGSVRFEKEQQMKKTHVFKYLLRLCVVRCLRPDRVVLEVKRFLGSIFDHRFMEPPEYNLPGFYTETNKLTPILLILSPSVNTLNELQILKTMLSSRAKIHYLPLGNTIDDKVRNNGDWVLLENLHLATDWLLILEKFIQKIHSEGVHDNFRLWLSTMPVDYFPVPLLQSCQKINLQTAKGIKQNALKLFNSMTDSNLEECRNNSKAYKKLFYCLCVFHATIVERKKFGPLGWNRPYEFTDADFFISLSQLKTFINASSIIPFELLLYLIGKLNYGGRITLKQDEEIFMSILDGFINPEVIQDDYENLCSGTYYQIPNLLNLMNYKKNVKKFPIVDRPEIFGLDENATIIRSQNEAKILLERVFELEFASKNLIKTENTTEETEEMIANKYTAIKDKMHKIITELPELLNEEECKRKFPISYEECLNTLLLKEAQRFNLLLQVIYVSLKNTLKALEGVAHINPTLESIYSDITYGRVPGSWLKFCYPTFDSLPIFLSNLQDRILFFRGWIDWGHPQNFWLPGFFDQKSFVTTLLQQKARKNNKYFPTLALMMTPLPIDAKIPDPPKPKEHGDDKEEVIPFNDMEKEESASDFSMSSSGSKEKNSDKLSKIEEEKENTNSEKSNEGEAEEAKAADIYIHGLFIESGQWDYEKECLVEAKLRILNYIMPPFKIQVISKDEYRELYENQNYFKTPLFKISLREALQYDGECFVMNIPLKICEGTTPNFWLKRSTALFCHMNM